MYPYYSEINSIKLVSGREGVHVCRPDLEAAEPAGPQEQELAHPAMLRTVRRRVRLSNLKQMVLDRLGNVAFRQPDILSTLRSIVFIWVAWGAISNGR